MEIKIIRKKIKKLILKININGEIIISAPIRLPNKIIENFIKERREWIESNLKKIKNNIPSYNDGDKFILFGKSYILKIILSENNECYLQDNMLIISGKDLDLEKKITLFENFVKNRLKEILNIYISELSSKIGFFPSTITVKKMTSRWGSCNTHTKSISFSYYLYSKPLDAIEYVVLHELAHLPFPHHQKPFWDFVEKYMPDYKERKKMLKN